MKQFYIFTLISFLGLTSLCAQTTFDWETATNNGTSISQNVNGILATFTTSNTNPEYINANGFGGSSGFVVVSGSSNDSSVSITFSEPINVLSMFVFNGDSGNPDADWFFIPTGGANADVTATVPGISGVEVDLNWSDVTQITIFSASGLDWFGVDDIYSDYGLSTPEFSETKTRLKLYPNPTTDYIQISNLNTTENFKVYNVLGSEVISGQVSQNEKIDIHNLSNGMYLLMLDSGETMKFLKN